MRLGLGPPMPMLIRLELSHRGGNGMVKVVDRWVDGNGRVGVFLFVAGGSLSLLNFLYVGLPNISSCLASLDSSHDEGDDISKNYKGSRSTRPTRLNVLQSVRMIELRKPNAPIACTAAQTTTDNQNRGLGGRWGRGTYARSGKERYQG